MTTATFDHFEQAAKAGDCKLSKFAANVLIAAAGVQKNLARVHARQHVLGEAVKNTLTETAKGMLEKAGEVATRCSAFVGVKCTIGGLAATAVATVASVPALAAAAPMIATAAAAVASAVGSTVVGVVAATVVGLAGSHIEHMQHAQIQTIASKADAERGEQLVIKGAPVHKAKDVADVGAYMRQEAAAITEARNAENRMATMMEMGFKPDPAMAEASKAALKQQEETAQAHLAMAVALVGTPEIKAHYKTLLAKPVQEAIARKEEPFTTPFAVRDMKVSYNFDLAPKL